MLRAKALRREVNSWRNLVYTVLPKVVLCQTEYNGNVDIEMNNIINLLHVQIYISQTGPKR